MNYFLAYKYNQKTNFGTFTVKNWTDSGEWKNYYPSFYDLESDEQKEIEGATLGTMFPRVA